MLWTARHRHNHILWLILRVDLPDVTAIVKTVRSIYGELVELFPRIYNVSTIANVILRALSQRKQLTSQSGYMTCCACPEKLQLVGIGGAIELNIRFEIPAKLLASAGRLDTIKRRAVILAAIALEVHLTTLERACEGASKGCADVKLRSWLNIHAWPMTVVLNIRRVIWVADSCPKSLSYLCHSQLSPGLVHSAVHVQK